MDLKTLNSVVAQISEEKGIPQDKVLEIVELALAAAYKKEYGKKGQIIKAKFNPLTGEAKFWQVKLVLDENMIYSPEELEELKRKKQSGETVEEFEESGGAFKKVRFNQDRHIMLQEAKSINKDAQPGQEIYIDLPTKEEFGRIAAQTAKQVILQRIREAEREIIFSEYKAKEGGIVSGIIQRVDNRNVYFDLGKTVGILPKEEQIPGEFYRPGQRLRLYCLSVQKTGRDPIIILSRAYPKFLSKLFELEVPEISAGTVEIKSIAREPGSRSKIAVASKVEGVDPIGAMVGQRGTRVMAVIQELGGEKIDIIEYSEQPEKYIANALSPAKVLDVRIVPKNTALVLVSEDQLSLTIGKDGQNVRLAAKLTGWKIDVRCAESQAESQDQQLSELSESELEYNQSQRESKQSKS